MPINKNSDLYLDSIVFKFPPKTCYTEKVLIVFPSRRRLVWIQSSKRSLLFLSIPFPSYHSQFSPYIRQVKLTAYGLHVVHLNSFGDSPKEFKTNYQVPHRLQLYIHRSIGQKSKFYYQIFRRFFFYILGGLRNQAFVLHMSAACLIC
jgi:hypothetical protein